VVNSKIASFFETLTDAQICLVYQGRCTEAWANYA